MTEAQSAAEELVIRVLQPARANQAIGWPRSVISSTARCTPRASRSGLAVLYRRLRRRARCRYWLGLLQAGILRGHPRQPRPVEIRLAACDSADEVVAHKARDRHRRLFGLRCRQDGSDVLQPIAHVETRRLISLAHDQFAVGFVDRRVKEATGQDLNKSVRIDT